MSIKLTDGKNWSANVDGTGSLLDKLSLTVTGLKIGENWNNPVNKIDPKDLGPGNLAFKGSTPLPFAGSKLTVSANQSATIGGQKAGSLFGSGDPVDQPISLDGKCCLWVKLNGTLSVGVSGTLSGFGIGIKTNSYAEYRFNRIFSPDAAGNFEPLSQAVEELFDGATPPVDLAALVEAPVGSIFEFDCGGSVKVTGSYSIPTSTLPLATTAVPVLQQKLTLAADPSLSLSGSFEVSGALIFRVHKLSNTSARFYLFKKAGTTLAVTFDASAGITGGVGDKDFLDSIFQAIIPDSKVDLSSRDADLNKQLKDVSQDAVSSHLSATINAEASISSNTSHVFVIDVDLEAASKSPDASQAVKGLLHGDWSLTRRTGIPGVTIASDMLEKVTTSKHTFQFHLLNLFSFTSVTEFMDSARILKTPDGVVFTDHDTASRIQATANGTIAEPASLSKVLAQALQTTLAFKTGNASPALVDLSIAGHYFAYERDASADDLNEVALLCAALDCAIAGLKPHATRIGVVKFDASSKFDGNASDACFIGSAPDFTPKDQAEYIRHALDAIANLYAPADRFHAAAIDNQLWKSLNAAGNPGAMISDTYIQNFLQGNGGFDGNRQHIDQVMWLYRIWYTVTYWSKAMAEYAALLQTAKKLAARLPAGSTQQTREIQELMRQLSSKMHDAQEQENNFIDERAQFGLAALYLSSGKRASNDVCLTWNGTTKSATNPAALPGIAKVR
jgi:hypothetical protein